MQLDLDPLNPTARAQLEAQAPPRRWWARGGGLVRMMLAGLERDLPHVLERLPAWVRAGNVYPYTLQLHIATPPGSDRAAVARFYRRTHAAGLVVDHHEPLLGSPDVCGLHVVANLRALTFAANAAKSGAIPADRDPQAPLELEHAPPEQLGLDWSSLQCSD